MGIRRMDTVVLVYLYCKSRVRNSGLLFLQKKEAMGHSVLEKTPPSPKRFSAFKSILLEEKKTQLIDSQMPIEDTL